MLELGDPYIFASRGRYCARHMGLEVGKVRVDTTPGSAAIPSISLAHRSARYMIVLVYQWTCTKSTMHGLGVAAAHCERN